MLLFFLFFFSFLFQDLSFCWMLVLNYLFGEEPMQHLVALQKQGNMQTIKLFFSYLFRLVIVSMLFTGYLLKRWTKMSEKAKQRLRLWCRITNLRNSGKFLEDSQRKSRNMSQMTSLLSGPSSIRSGNGLWFLVHSFLKPPQCKIFSSFLFC